MRLLISGFEPFHGMLSNPSEKVLPLLEQELQNGEVRTCLLPVSFKNALLALKKEIDSFRPDVVISLGLAAGREKIGLERIAINLRSAPYDDNEQQRPLEEKIVQNGPDGLFSTLPLVSLMKACEQKQVPIEISNTAGTFVCNSVMYETLMLGKEKGFRSGFIHLPATPELRPDGPNLEIKEIQLGLQTMIEDLLNVST